MEEETANTENKKDWHFSLPSLSVSECCGTYLITDARIETKAGVRFTTNRPVKILGLDSPLFSCWELKWPKPSSDKSYITKSANLYSHQRYIKNSLKVWHTTGHLGFPTMIITQTHILFMSVQNDIYSSFWGVVGSVCPVPIRSKKPEQNLNIYLTCYSTAYSFNKCVYLVQHKRVLAVPGSVVRTVEKSQAVVFWEFVSLKQASEAWQRVRNDEPPS